MESGRLYREAHSVQYIIDEIKKFSGTQFDPKVVDEAVKLLETKNLGEAVFSRDENSVAT
jgi:HD-GYP domain-containing protein (c-di-GMP phosphodiesterase class II)